MYNQDNQDEQVIWNAFQAKRADDKDAKAEEEYEGFMSAVNNGDTQALQAIADEAWEYTPTSNGDEDLDDTAWDVSLWDFTPTATEEVAPAPRFPPNQKLWREAHPNAFVFEDDDEEWVNNTTPTEADEVAPYSFPMPYPEDNEDLYDEDANEDFSIGWRYYPTPENPDAWIAVAPSRRALRAYIRDGRILLNNPKVIRVSYRR